MILLSLFLIKNKHIRHKVERFWVMPYTGERKYVIKKGGFRDD